MMGFQQELGQKQLRILISAGPTREYLDDIRYLSNNATGTLGSLLAEQGLKQGAQVILVQGPCQAQSPEGVTLKKVVSAAEMFESIQREIKQADIFISSAAVADYRPKKRFSGKHKKAAQDLSLPLEPTTDILAWVGQNKSDRLMTVGFALESDPDPKLAWNKLKAKRCDLLVHNSPENFGREGGGLLRIISPEGLCFEGELKKAALAEKLMSLILELYQKKQTR